MNWKNKKCQIAYFSRKGQNYSSGKIVDLKVGNTEIVVKMIQMMTEGDLFYIDTVKAYPKDYYGNNGGCQEQTAQQGQAEADRTG